MTAAPHSATMATVCQFNTAGPELPLQASVTLGEEPLEELCAGALRR